MILLLWDTNIFYLGLCFAFLLNNIFPKKLYIHKSQTLCTIVQLLREESIEKNYMDIKTVKLCSNDDDDDDECGDEVKETTQRRTRL